MQQESEAREFSVKVLSLFAVDGAFGDKTPLNFTKVKEGLAKAYSIDTRAEYVQKTQAIRNRAEDAIRDTENGDPTAAGMLKLRQKLKEIWAGADSDGDDRMAAADIYVSVSHGILETVPPLCALVAQGIDAAVRQLSEIETTLEQNPRANIDAALRELKKTLCTGVNASFENAAEFGRYLDAAGVTHLKQYLVARAIRDITSWKAAMLDHFLGPKYGPWRRPKASDA